MTLREKFKEVIDDYNSIVNNPKFIDTLNTSIENLKSNNDEISDKLLNSIRNEFSEIKKNNSIVKNVKNLFIM